MKADPLFLEYVNASAELQAVSLSDLGRRERIAFFINIYNALIVHGTIVREVPDNLLKRLSFFSSLKYNIGGHDFSAGEGRRHDVMKSGDEPYIQYENCRWHPDADGNAPCPRFIATSFPYIICLHSTHIIVMMMMMMTMTMTVMIIIGTFAMVLL